MNLSIKAFFTSLGVLNLLIAGVLVLSLYELDQSSHRLKDIEHNRFLMIQKADELRQTSDDLTRFVRTYAVTLDERYRQGYHSVLGIRNGKDIRPMHQERIYWDLLEPLRSLRHPLDKRSSLKKEMEKLPYTKYEIEKLKESENNSNQLVSIEIEAFNALEGLYKDKDGRYTIKKRPDQQLAIGLLHSDSYHKAKERIMLPIDEFLASLDERTQKEIETYNDEVTAEIRFVAIVFSVNVLILILAYLFIAPKILTPIKRMTRLIDQYQNGERGLKETVENDDEIGSMIRHFFVMMQSLDKRFDIIQKITITDELTNVYNRKYYNEKVSESLSLYKRYKTPFSMIMYDIDRFKDVNDTHGHDVGDKVLVKSCVLVRALIRESDHIFRIGGEEFIVILSETKLAEATSVAEKIRQSFSVTSIFKDVYITISAGLTEVRPNDTEESIYQRVDDLLYLSKKDGRDKVSTQIVGDVL